MPVVRPATTARESTLLLELLALEADPFTVMIFVGAESARHHRHAAGRADRGAVVRRHVGSIPPARTVQLPAGGYRVVMSWILKGLVVLARTRRGRKLLLAAGLGAVEWATSERAQRLYATARTKVIDPAVRQVRARA